MPSDGSRVTVAPFAVRMLLVLLFIIWSNSFTAIKHLREIFSPVELVIARFLPVAVICVIYLSKSKRAFEECVRIFSEAPVRITLMSLFGVAGYNYFLYLGQSEIKPGAAALITTLAPLITLILAIVFLKETVPLKRTIGIVLSFAGLYIVIRWGKVGLGNVTGISHAEVRYALIASLAPLSWSLYTIIGKDLVKKYSPLTVTYLSLVIGTVPFFFFLTGDFFLKAASMSPTHWIALAHLSILCTIVGFWIWNFGLQHLPATSVASFIYLNPPLAALFGWLFYGEEVTGYFLGGGAVVLTGLYLAQRRNG